MIISPSVLSANFLELGKDVEMLNESQAEWIHFDVMDGMFVPNISFGLPVLQHVNKIAKKVLDVHLMIEDPGRYIDAFKQAGAEILTVHYEACTHLHRTVQQIHQSGMKAGVSLNPHTPISVLEEIIEDVDVVLLMSVNPGFGGQKFIERTYDKVKQLQAMIVERNSKAIIEIDGGVNLETGAKLKECGVDAVVAGSFVFNSENPSETIAKLKAL